MVALRQAGQTVAQIATRFGFHRTTVARHLKQAGEMLRTNPADSAFQERVREAYAEIGTVKRTAQRLGVSKDTVRKVVRGGGGIVELVDSATGWLRGKIPKECCCFA